MLQNTLQKSENIYGLLTPVKKLYHFNKTTLKLQ